MNWTMNKTGLQTGMVIRRPGLDEALEVVKVRGNEAKIKLPGGKTSTIPAAAEVEFAWPEKEEGSKLSTKPEITTEQTESVESAETEIAHSTTTEPESDDWQTDWSLLGVGAKVSVLGESGTFTVLRLTDSSARIKHDTTGQIQPMSIGHKFRMLKSGSTPASKKPRSKKAAPKPEPEPEELKAEDEPELPFDQASEPQTSEEVTEHQDEEVNEVEEAEPEIATDNELSDDDPDSIDPDEEENNMPKSSKPSAPDSDNQLLTLVEIAERTGISYPTLSRYVREHGDRLPSEGSGRKRRFYASAIDVFKQIRGESRIGRKPKEGSKRTATKTSRKPKSTKGALDSGKEFEGSKSTTARTPSASASSSAWMPATGQTIDAMLASAIDHAEAQIAGLQSLIANLTAQREQLKLWS